MDRGLKGEAWEWGWSGDHTIPTAKAEFWGAESECAGQGLAQVLG